jgi:hypothetical protein
MREMKNTNIITTYIEDANINKTLVMLSRYFVISNSNSQGFVIDVHSLRFFVYNFCFIYCIKYQHFIFSKKIVFVLVLHTSKVCVIEVFDKFNQLIGA